MKIETQGALKLSVSEKDSCVRIDVARLRSAEDLMDPLGSRAVSKFLIDSNCPNLVLNLGTAGVVSAQMLDWFVKKWMPTALAHGVRRVAIVTANDAHRMLGSMFDSCTRLVRSPQALKFFTAMQLKSGTELSAWLSAPPSAAIEESQLELAVHAFGGVPFVCVDFPLIETMDGYKQALFNEEILEFIRANQGNNLLLNFTASTVFGKELPDWIREIWLEIAAGSGVKRVLVALQSQVHGTFSNVLRPATFKKANSFAQVKYCGESEVFDTGEALNWFKDQQAA